jgi:hypothetical protein
MSTIARKLWNVLGAVLCILIAAICGRAAIKSVVVARVTIVEASVALLFTIMAIAFIVKALASENLTHRGSNQWYRATTSRAHFFIPLPLR